MHRYAGIPVQARRCQKNEEVMHLCGSNVLHHMMHTCCAMVLLGLLVPHSVALAQEVE